MKEKRYEISILFEKMEEYGWPQPSEVTWERNHYVCVSPCTFIIFAEEAANDD